VSDVARHKNATLIKYISHEPDRRIVLERYSDGTFAAYIADFNAKQQAINPAPIEDMQQLRGIQWDYGNIEDETGGWHFHDFRKGDPSELDSGGYSGFVNYLKAQS
jgi:hypothetical protein